VRGATERRSRDNADHAPVEEPERSGPETLHDILTRPDVGSSGYSEDGFKVLLSFVKSKAPGGASSASEGVEDFLDSDVDEQ
jgi:hypothetical protein